TQGEQWQQLRRVRRVRHRHRHDARAAGKAVQRIQPGRCNDRPALRRHRARPCPLAQARSHDGWRRDCGERAQQRLGVYRASARGREHVNAPEREGSIQMKLPRRQFLHLAAGAAALPAVARIARAQAYPSRPVRLIVPAPAGGGYDLTARLISQVLSERLGAPFIVDNRPGGGGNIGTEAVVRASPDGYTLLLVAAANAINATFYEKLNFNFIRDIA